MSIGRRGHHVINAVVLLVLAALSVIAPLPADSPSPGPPPGPAPGPPIGRPDPSRAGVDLTASPSAGATSASIDFRIGVTHTQYTADRYNAPDSVASAEAVLRTAVSLQNQHIMGFGADNPEPAPGVFQWETLDARIDLIRRTSGEPTITLCCCPDWMKGGVPGSTDWTKIETAPAPKHFDDFARLAATIARRYPDVTRFLVWNELKGFWDTRRNVWNIELYTRLYNKVYRAMKAVNPAIQIGGPYVTVDSWSSCANAGQRAELRGPWGCADSRALDSIRYWLAHASGADFLVIDGSNKTRDRGLIVSDVRSNDKFAAVTSWLKRRTSLPIWWAEIYPAVNNEHEGPGSPRRAAVAIDALLKLVDAGASAALLWQPQAAGELPSVALWTDTSRPNGGKPLPMVSPLVWLLTSLNSGQRPVARWDRNVLIIRDHRQSLLINAELTPARITCGDQPVSVLHSSVVTSRC